MEQEKPEPEQVRRTSDQTEGKVSVCVFVVVTLTRMRCQFGLLALIAKIANLA